MTTENKLGYGLEVEAMRMVSNFLKWVPEEYGGIAVKSVIKIPIRFI